MPLKGKSLGSSSNCPPWSLSSETTSCKGGGENVLSVRSKPQIQWKSLSVEVGCTVEILSWAGDGFGVCISQKAEFGHCQPHFWTEDAGWTPHFWTEDTEFLAPVQPSTAGLRAALLRNFSQGFPTLQVKSFSSMSHLWGTFRMAGQDPEQREGRTPGRGFALQPSRALFREKFQCNSVNLKHNGRKKIKKK